MSWSTGSLAVSRNGGFTLIELLVVIGIIGLIASISVVSLSSIRIRARDTRRIEDARTIRTALEVYQGEYQRLPSNTQNDNGGWDIGNTKLDAENTFIQPLVDAQIFQQTPKEIFFSPQTYPTYQYFKYENDQNCGGTFAIFGIRLEGRKQDYTVSNTLEDCYTKNNNAFPNDDHWLGYMIRQF